MLKCSNIGLKNIEYFYLSKCLEQINGIFNEKPYYKKSDDLTIPFLEKLVLLEKFHALIKPTPCYKIKLKNSNTLYLKDEGAANFSVKMRSVMGLFVSGIIFNDIKYNTIITNHLRQYSYS